MLPDKLGQRGPNLNTNRIVAPDRNTLAADKREIDLGMICRTGLSESLTPLSSGLIDRLQRQMIKAMTRVAEARDLYLYSHQSRVAVLAKSIAERLGATEDQVEGVYYAGLLHDIGKICIPSEILCKTAKLNADEIGIVRRHSESGYEILKDIEFTWPIAAVVRQHHERINGSGYPLGLAGGEIHYAARIVAVADVVEAMASARPYRPPLGAAFALNEISTNSGVLYDPDVVAACLALFNTGFTFQLTSSSAV